MFSRLITILCLFIYDFHCSNEDEEEGNSENQTKHQSQVQFKPVLYNFRSPPKSSEKRYVLQMPFAQLFDNLIAVLWSLYSQQEDKKIFSGKIYSYHYYLYNQHFVNQYDKSYK